MPVYNAERYVGEAIDSILRQTFADFEFLIINDGSTDGSAEILRQYAQRDHRIRFYDFTENAGLIARLNQGIDLAQGEYLARMDADDVSDPERFAEQFRFLETHHEVVMVGSSAYMLYENARIEEAIFSLSNDLIPTELCFRNCFVHASIMARTDVLRAYKYDPAYYAAEDYFLWSQLSQRHKLAILARPLVTYRIHDSNISRRKREQQRATMKKIYRFHLARLGLTDVTEEEVQLHFEIFLKNADFHKALDRLHALRWVTKLARAHQKYRIFDPMYFQARLRQAVEKYLRDDIICRCGIKAIPFLLSPFAPGHSWRMIALSVMKCFKYGIFYDDRRRESGDADKSK